MKFSKKSSPIKSVNIFGIFWNPFTSLPFLTIDLSHNGDQIYYSFILMLISLSNLAAMGKIQKNI